MASKRTSEPALMRRLYMPIATSHLKYLASKAATERDAFFERNPAAAPLYKDRFLAAALCQGAANHFLNVGRKGVNDFDIHLFYLQNPEKKRLSRKVRSTREAVPDFGERKIDFIRTVVPERVRTAAGGDIVTLLRDFLRSGVTKNAQHLAHKAVIGLLPDHTLGATIWPHRQ